MTKYLGAFGKNEQQLCQASESAVPSKDERPTSQQVRARPCLAADSVGVQTLLEDDLGMWSLVIGYFAHCEASLTSRNDVPFVPVRRRAPRPRPGDEQSPFFVPPFLDLVGGLVHHFPNFWLGLGRLESSLLAGELRPVAVTAPIFVCGLARSGSTLLHEIVAAHPGVATHRLKDFPMLWTPCWWRRATTGLRAGPARERAHQDRVMISADSPDALEEMLWLAFFPRRHDPSVSNLFGPADHHPAFEAFYRMHIRKLLLAENASRYVAKANYHVARLPYLVRLFPDARFLIPIREPVGHIASLVRQHRKFSDGQRRQPRSLTYMQHPVISSSAWTAGP